MPRDSHNRLVFVIFACIARGGVRLFLSAGCSRLGAVFALICGESGPQSFDPRVASQGIRPDATQRALIGRLGFDTVSARSAFF